VHVLDLLFCSEKAVHLLAIEYVIEIMEIVLCFCETLSLRVPHFVGLQQ